MRSRRWARFDYRYQVGPNTVWPPTGPGGRADLDVDELLVAIARARRYPGYEPGFADQARAAVRLLCTFVFADPGLAPPSHRQRARRARQIGGGCYNHVWLVINHPYEAYQLKRQNPHLPISSEDVLDAALEEPLVELCGDIPLTFFIGGIGLEIGRCVVLDDFLGGKTRQGEQAQQGGGEQLVQHQSILPSSSRNMRRMPSIMAVGSAGPEPAP